MAEGATVKVAVTDTDPVTVTYIGGAWGVVPAASSVASSGEVYFVCGIACWIWTMVNNVLVNAFVGETNNYLVCAPGQSPAYSVAPAYANSTITVIPEPPNSNPPTAQLAAAQLHVASVRGTIKVSSSGVITKQDKK